MQKSAPNVLLIMTDQHRFDLMNCAGNAFVKTPNIDRIARRGVRFTNAYCGYPVCLASRSAMLTGLYAHTTGAVNNTDTLDWRYRTMAHHFADQGYLSGLVGKMHFNDACKHGYEFYASINDWLMSLGPKARMYADEIANHQLSPHFGETVYDDGAGFPDYDCRWKDGISPWRGQVAKFAEGRVASAMDEDDHLDRFVARECARFLERYRNQPFFLTASFMKPHTPFYPPARHAAMYPVGEMPLKDPGDLSIYPQAARNLAKQYQHASPLQQRAARAGYYGNLAFVDECVGMLCNSLEGLGLLDNTIVVYTSDHGEMDGDHGLYQKFCLFEPSVKVPMIFSWPGKLPQNAVCSDPVSQVGLYPTLAELSGTGPAACTPRARMDNPPCGLEVESFAESIINPGSGRDRGIFVEYGLKNPGHAQRMVRCGPWKCVVHETGEGELYNLENDPDEMRNLYEKPECMEARKRGEAAIGEWIGH